MGLLNRLRKEAKIREREEREAGDPAAGPRESVPQEQQPAQTATPGQVEQGLKDFDRDLALMVQACRLTSIPNKRLQMKGLVLTTWRTNGAQTLAPLAPADRRRAVTAFCAQAGRNFRKLCEMLDIGKADMEDLERGLLEDLGCSE